MQVSQRLHRRTFKAKLIFENVVFKAEALHGCIMFVCEGRVNS